MVQIFWWFSPICEKPGGGVFSGEVLPRGGCRTRPDEADRLRFVGYNLSLNDGDVHGISW